MLSKRSHKQSVKAASRAEFTVISSAERMNIFFWTTYSIFAPSGYTMNADASRSKLFTIDNSFSFVTYEPRKKQTGIETEAGTDGRTDVNGFVNGFLRRGLHL